MPCRVSRVAVWLGWFIVVALSDVSCHFARARASASAGRSLEGVDRSDAFVGYAERAGAGSATTSRASASPAASSEGPCLDRDQNCASWARGGECENNPGFMLSSCALSCRACGPNSAQAGATKGTSCRFDGKGSGELTIGVRLNGDAREIRIRLYPGVAPAAVASMWDGAARGPPTCEFYRAEPKPLPGAIDNYGGPGPPYGLVQGRLGTLRAGKVEASVSGCPVPPLKRGSVAAINGGPDFMLCVSDHPEWNHAFVQFGEVADQASLDVMDAIVAQPTHGESWGATKTVVLDQKVPCTTRLEPSS